MFHKLTTRASPSHLAVCLIQGDERSLRRRRLLTSDQLTDLYLGGLAAKHGGRLATSDAGIDASLITGGPAACIIIPQ
jgi:hypothetical protein